MQARLIELHQQRGRLLERIAHQRVTLAAQMVPLAGPLALPERLVHLVQNGKAFVRQHPYLVGTGIAAVVLLKPRWVWRWTQRGLLAWRTWRSVRGMLPAVLTNVLSGYRPPR